MIDIIALHMLAAEIEKIIDESSRKLLQSASPSVKFWTYTHVLGKDREDSAVQRTLDECQRYPPRINLLRSIREDGTWQPSQRANSDRGMASKAADPVLSTAYRNLLRLLHFVTMPDDEGVDRAIERILMGQSKDGCLVGPMTHGFPQPHYNGFALYLLCGFFKERDPRVVKTTDWLMSMQRKDGGWLMPYLQDLRYRPEYQGMTLDEFIELIKSDGSVDYDPKSMSSVPSCHWTTLVVLWGLANNPSNKNNRCLRKGADFLLGRFFERNPHPNYYERRDNWTKLRYPNYRCGGLAALEVLTLIGKGPDDARMEKPMKWLLSERYRDGFWTVSNRPHGERDQWLTLGALETLRDYSRNI